MNKKQLELNTAMKVFLNKGNKIQIIPSQKYTTKFVSKGKFKSSTRFGWQNLASMYRKAA